MNQKAKGRKGVVAGVAGLSALGLAGQADAATEVMGQVADGRLGTILTLFVPVLGWVLFNALGPAQNQLDNMNQKAKGRK